MLEVSVVEVRGNHNDAMSSEVLDLGFVSVVWEAIPDIRSIGSGQDLLRRREGRPNPR